FRGLLAPSKLSAMSAYSSAFGAQPTCRDRTWRIHRALLTHSGHRLDRNLAAQQSPAVPSVLSFRRSTGAVGSEATRVHHSARRRDGRVVARGARAAAAGNAGDWLPPPRI